MILLNTGQGFGGLPFSDGRRAGPGDLNRPPVSLRTPLGGEGKRVLIGEPVWELM